MAITKQDVIVSCAHALFKLTEESPLAVCLTISPPIMVHNLYSPYKYGRLV